MAKFTGEQNPIVEVVESFLGDEPYRKETHEFGYTWYQRGGDVSIEGDGRYFILQESAKRRGIRRTRFEPSMIRAGIAEPESGGLIVTEYVYSQKTDLLAVNGSMVPPEGETAEEFRVRQSQVRREFFSPDAIADVAERQRFTDLLQMIGEKGLLLDQAS